MAPGHWRGLPFGRGAAVARFPGSRMPGGSMRGSFSRVGRHKAATRVRFVLGALGVLLPFPPESVLTPLVLLGCWRGSARRRTEDLRAARRSAQFYRAAALVPSAVTGMPSVTETAKAAGKVPVRRCIRRIRAAPRFTT